MQDNHNTLVKMNQDRGSKLDDLQKANRKRQKCEQLAESFKRLGFDAKAERVDRCGTELVFAHLLKEDRLILHQANYCKERLCPMCAWLRTRQVFARVSTVMNEIQKERPMLVPLFLTLTLRNCEPSELSKTLDVVFQGWNRLTNNKKMKRLIVGWFRALEVTYNENADTYHPHVHAILLVEPTYFTNPKDYMPTEKWVATWRKTLRLDYDPICNVQAIDTENQVNAVAEVAKYTVKDVDYLKDSPDLTDKLVSTFGAAIKGRRLYAFGGLMKEVAKRLNLDNEQLTSDEVLDENGTPLRKDIDYVLLFYRWHIGLARYEMERRV